MKAKDLIKILEKYPEYKVETRNDKGTYKILHVKTILRYSDSDGSNKRIKL